MLIFDFDGVLINSLNEIVLTAFNAVSGKLMASPNDLPEGLPELFKRNRFHIQPIGDALPFMAWCLDTYQNNPDYLMSQKEFLKTIQNTDIPLIDRTKRFFAARNRFMVANKEHWLNLNKPYQPVWNELKRYESKTVILTNKNRMAVIDLCDYFDLNLSTENIYSGEDGTTKIENMNRIMDRFGGGPYFFIDDSLKNLNELDISFNAEMKRLNLILASWGYVGPDDECRAVENRYSVFNQQDLAGNLSEHFIESRENDET